CSASQMRNMSTCIAMRNTCQIHQHKNDRNHPQRNASRNHREKPEPGNQQSNGKSYCHDACRGTESSGLFCNRSEYRKDMIAKNKQGTPGQSAIQIYRSHLLITGKILQQPPEHPEPQHIAENMPETQMHKHESEQGPGMRNQSMPGGR